MYILVQLCIYCNETWTGLNGRLSTEAKREINELIQLLPRSMRDLINKPAYSSMYLICNAVNVSNIVTEYVLYNLNDVAKLNDLVLLARMRNILNPYYDNIIEFRLHIQEATKQPRSYFKDRIDNGKLQS